MKSANVMKIAGLAGLVLAAGNASAGFTAVNAPSTMGEMSHEQILEGIYGGNFSPAGVNYTNGAVTATRIDDFGVGGMLNLAMGGPGTADDSVWNDGVAAAAAEARFAGFEQNFGYFNGASGGAFTQLFATSGSGFAVSGSGLVDFTGGTWRWGRTGGPNVHSGLASENADGVDHMVTYRITGLGGATTWLVFFEDKNMGDEEADFDYNDLVVEIVAVPTPMAAGMGLAGLAGVAGVRRRRTA
jgi:MYXO-CTERM domain-containing protein